ncbi:MAG: ribosomal protein S18-alanine N-acetyltransferase [Chrysiogenia bacterium]
MPKAIWPEPTAPLIRRAAAADLPAILQIECEQFSNPWRLDYFSAELANSFSNFFVVENPASGTLTGYLLFWRLGVELELHKIAVAQAWQGQGIALHLMEFLVRTARSWGNERVVLEVRAHNTPAVNLYEKFDFRCVGRRRDYYDRPVDDALLYELAL